MNRRAFFSRVSAAVAGFALSRTLGGIVPLPSPAVVPTWHDETVRQLARELENSLELVARIDRDYDRQFARAGMPRGSVIHIRKPARFA